MIHNRCKNSSQAGVSLVELLMVTVVIAIVSGLALVQFGTSRPQFQRQNTAQLLKQAFQRARFDSVKRRVGGTIPAANVIIDQSSFALVTDANTDGDIADPDDTLLTSFTGQNISITGSGMAFPVTVTFDKRGEVTAVDNSSATVNPVFLVCNGSCTFPTATTSNANIVVVTPTGTVNLLPGGAAIPSFAPPAISNIPGGDDINDDVRIP